MTHADVALLDGTSGFGGQQSRIFRGQRAWRHINAPHCACIPRRAQVHINSTVGKFKGGFGSFRSQFGHRVPHNSGGPQR